MLNYFIMTVRFYVVEKLTVLLCMFCYIFVIFIKEINKFVTVLVCVIFHHRYIIQIYIIHRFDNLCD